MGYRMPVVVYPARGPAYFLRKQYYTETECRAVFGKGGGGATKKRIFVLTNAVGWYWKISYFCERTIRTKFSYFFNLFAPCRPHFLAKFPRFFFDSLFFLSRRKTSSFFILLFFFASFPPLLLFKITFEEENWKFERSENFGWKELLKLKRRRNGEKNFHNGKTGIVFFFRRLFFSLHCFANEKASSTLYSRF